MTSEQSDMVQANLGLAWKAARAVSRRYALQRADQEDAVSAAYLGLCAAAIGFDPARPASWSSYAYRAAFHAAQAEMHFRAVIQPPLWHLQRPNRDNPLVAEAQRLRQVCALPAEGISRSDDPTAAAEQADDLAALRRAVVEGLGDRERTAVLEWADGATFVEIGRRRGITKEGARKIVLCAIGRLRRRLNP